MPGTRKSRWPARGLLAIASAIVLAACSVQAANLLVNPSFEANSGNVVAAGWTYFRPPNGGDGSYWCDSAGGRAHSGNLYWKQWGIYWDAARTNVAGIYQQFNSAPGATYQASGWFYTLATDVMGPNNKAWLEVSFRNSSGQVLALYKSDDFSALFGTSEWFNLPVTNVCDLAQPIPSGDTNSAYFYYVVTNSVSQLVAPPGTAFVRYQFAMVQGGGWPEGGGAVYLDDVVLDQLSGPVPPTITSLSPPNPSMFVVPADGVTFTATSPSGTTIDPSGIRMTVNGQDVSGSLTVGGTASSRTVRYSGLQSNTVYNVTVSVTDVLNFTATASTYFETTWVGTPPVAFLWEAEDFDFTNGMYVTNPELCNTSGNPNCYFGKVGVEGVDEHSVNSAGDHLYRPDDPMSTTGSGDLLRKNLVEAGRLDYKVGWFNGNEWVNYTRDWPRGDYWIVARLANGGGSGVLTLSKVNPDSSTTGLGTFTVTGSGWTAYYNTYLKDTYGNNAIIHLDGKATLRATTGGNVDMGLFMLVNAQVDLPTLSNVYPNGAQPFQYTNTFSFTATSIGGNIPNSGIKVVLDGQDVSSSLTFSGSDSSKNVVYPNLLPNALHTATVTVTNLAGSGISRSFSFDTFSEANYMVEAEDFDHDGGQYIDPPLPNSYLALEAVTNIDYIHAPAGGERFDYRRGLPNERASDYVRKAFADAGATDYNVGWFNNPEWGNYTHQYPAGTYRVYGRFAGSGGYSMYLDQVVSGATTTNQVTKRLGRWGFVGRDWQLYDWVPLTDEGLAAPVTITLNGLTTLRITTTGGCNPNFFMLVPVSGINVSAKVTNGKLAISFPTQVGVTYRVFYKNDLATGNWTLLTSVLGDGTVKSPEDTIAAGGRRFYQVVAP